MESMHIPSWAWPMAGGLLLFLIVAGWGWYQGRCDVKEPAHDAPYLDRVSRAAVSSPRRDDADASPRRAGDSAALPLMWRGQGVARIAAERWRQVEEEGWSAEHDDKHHRNGELVKAAICYARCGAVSVERRNMSEVPSIVQGWPWHPNWFKPADNIRDLEKAGALIAAEIDRLERLQGGKQSRGAGEQESRGAVSSAPLHPCSRSPL